MKERPIIFSGPMVRAILDDRKTQTRRVVKPQPGPDIAEDVLRRCRPMQRRNYRYVGTNDGHEISLRCPYGQPGDRLWVRETWRPWWDEDPPAGSGLYCVVQYRCDMAIMKPGLDAMDNDTGHRFADACDRAPDVPWRPSIHMPRWASRITLEVVGVRVERVQEISEADCIAEGIGPEWNGRRISGLRHEFSTLWDSINAKRGFGWDVNAWVWVVEFRRIM